MGYLQQMGQDVIVTMLRATTLSKRAMIHFSKGAKELLRKLFETMPQSEKDRLGRDVTQKFDDIITGDEQREFRITENDIVSLINQGGYKL